MTKICPNCKKENQDTSKFCKNCGTTLNGMKSISNRGNAKNKSGGIKEWWSKQTKGVRILSVISICCLGLILVIGLIGLLTPDTNTYTTADTTNTAADTTSSSSSTPTTTTTDTTTDSKFSGLNNPSAVESVLSKYDYNYDDKIEFVDEDSSNPDGQEEYAVWAIDAGFDSSDSYTLAYMFDKFDANSDEYWDIYELDKFYDDYYSNN